MSVATTPWLVVFEQVRLACLPSGPEEEQGQYLMEHVMGLELLVIGRCPRCRHEITRSTCDIAHAAELLPMIEVGR